MCSATITSRPTSSPTSGGTRWSAGSWRAGGPGVSAVGPTEPPPPSAAALFLAESIASAFDLYLVGRLVPTAARVRVRHDAGSPRWRNVPATPGCPSRSSRRCSRRSCAEPERAFEDLRGAAVRRGDRAAGVPRRRPGPGGPRGLRRSPASRRCCTIIGSRTGSSMRARMRPCPFGSDAVASEVDRALREAPVSLDWLDSHFVEAAVDPGPAHRADALANAQSRAHRRRQRAHPVSCSASATRCA